MVVNLTYEAFCSVPEVLTNGRVFLAAVYVHITVAHSVLHTVDGLVSLLATICFDQVVELKGDGVPW